MSVLRIERDTALPVGEAWRRVTDWPAHGAQVPLTRSRVLTPGTTGPGTRFVARTGVGRLTVDDPMEVVRWEPPSGTAPGRCRLEKYGRWVLGWAEIEVHGRASGSRVVWVEELRVRGLPRFFDPVLARAGRAMFGRALDGLLKSPPGADI